METKLFEVRDRATFLPVLAVKLNPASEEERYLLAMTGYGLQAKVQSQYILVGMLRTGKLACVPVEQIGYPAVRTMASAHEYILKNWDGLKTGDVVDVEYISGETVEPKKSQRLEEFGDVIKDIIERKY